MRRVGGKGQVSETAVDSETGVGIKSRLWEHKGWRGGRMTSFKLSVLVFTSTHIPVQLLVTLMKANY